MRKKFGISDDVLSYEYLFKEREKSGKKSNWFLFKIIKKNFWDFFWTTIIYVLKASPFYILPVITANIINSVTGYMGGAIAWATCQTDLIVNLSVFVGMIILYYPLNMWWSAIASKLYRNNSANIRAMVIKKLQGLSITYHKEMESGKVQSKFLRDIESVDMLIAIITNVIVPAVCGVIIAIIIAIARSGIMTVFFVVAIPINVLIVLGFKNKMRKNSHAIRESTEKVSTKLTTMMDMLTVTKAHGLEAKEYERFHADIDELEVKCRTADMTNARFSALTWVASNFLSVTCLGFTIYLAIIGRIAVGDIVLYQSLFSAIDKNVTLFVNIMPNISQGLEAVRSIAEIMNTADMEENGGKETDSVKGQVEFKNVCYRYPDKAENVVDDFSLSVKAGECIAVVGSSGSGKSTLMNIIIGLLKPTSGEVKIDGHSLTELSLADYRKYLSVVPQNSILFNGTIRENITYGLEDYKEEELQSVLDMANVREFLNDLPNGLETVIGEHGDKLSGGQKQRITIARALLRNPKILILDEATSALDNISEYNVQSAISNSVKNRTTFVVAHRLSTIRDADRIVVMEHGKAVEVGDYDTLMAKKGKFYKLKYLNDLNYKKANDMLSGGNYLNIN